ncbi:MAG TPA: ABC transporter substrate-binding protein [Acidimicrobiales bacterium]
MTAKAFGTTRTGRPRHRARRRGLKLAAVAAALTVLPTALVSTGVGGASVPVSQASTSTRGVTATTINVAFPVANLDSLASTYGFAGDIEYTEQAKAIHLFVNQVNDSGGINGRKINPIITTYNPANDASMQALCENWTQGNPPIFAVLDGVGTFTGTNELCVTQQGHTPMLSQWTTVSSFTQAGSPYLWWTGPDDAAVLQALVTWGKGQGTIGGKAKLGVVVGDRASDQAALNKYLLPDLKRVGVTPVVETIPAQTSEGASTSSDSTLVVEKLHAAGVTSMIPLIPFNAFLPVLEAQTQQQYFPKLLLSDYENSIESSLGLIPVPYAKALNGQEGVTTETLGGVDDPRPEAQGGYDPGVRSCWTAWHKAYPEIPKGNMNDDIEEQGPVQGWCQEIRLFAAAAKAAGKNLNRRTFVTAMSQTKNFPGGYSPILSYGPTKFYGPTQYQVVRLHVNSPPTSQCRIPLGNLPPQVVCWTPVQPWKPLPTAA